MIHAKANDGYTACMFASMKGHSSIVSMLLDKGTNVYAADNKGYIACMIASQNGIRSFFHSINETKYNIHWDLILVKYGGIVCSVISINYMLYIGSVLSLRLETER